ncbi:MAG: PspC domain-containing protein [Bacteroidota bacterium]|nr:PspC domain-containing protein [Bacteroidota bacterium]
MNKTVTINISGIIFHIEEDAYQTLSNYLSTIKGYFSKTDGGNEIMADIEARIAELLQQKISVNKQVVLMNDVENVMQIMGKPEEFAGDENTHKSNDEEANNSNASHEKIKRRLFRNPDEKAIGGVCSGLAAYFDVDTVWVRLAMFLLIFFGGLSLWVYIVMWIIIPEAKTTADRLAMRGEPATIDNISKTVKEEAADLKNRYAKNFGKNVRNGAHSAASTLGNVIGRLFGLFLVFIGGVLLIAYVSSIFGISVADSSSDFTNWKSVIFNSGSYYVWAIISFIIVFGIPVFMLLYTGIKILFKIHYSNRWLNYSLGFLWLLGFILGFYITVKTVKQFSETSKIKETYQLHNMGDTIVVKLNPSAEVLKNYAFENIEEIETHFQKNHNNYYLGESKSNLSIIGQANLDVVESNSDSIELIVYNSAQGLNKQDANQNAKSIKYKFTQNGNQIIFDEIFTVIADQKFRAQRVNMRLKLPIGKVIYFDKSVKYLLDDVSNITNTWDGDMVGRRWKMTDKGLACIDCNGLDSDSDDEDGESVSKKIVIQNGEVIIDETKTHSNGVSIDDDGIKIKGKDTKIKIDENGIKVNDKDANVKIDENGHIKIKTIKHKKEKEGE